MKVKDVILKVPKEKRIDRQCDCSKNIGYNQARTEILNSEIDLSKVVDVEKICDKIFEELQTLLSGYQHSKIFTDDGCNIQLVDLLTPEGDKDITRGKEEVIFLAEDILDFLEKALKAEEPKWDSK